MMAPRRQQTGIAGGWNKVTKGDGTRCAVIETPRLSCPRSQAKRGPSAAALGHSAVTSFHKLHFKTRFPSSSRTFCGVDAGLQPALSFVVVSVAHLGCERLSAVRSILAVLAARQSSQDAHRGTEMFGTQRFARLAQRSVGRAMLGGLRRPLGRVAPELHPGSPVREHSGGWGYPMMGAWPGMAIPPHGWMSETRYGTTILSIRKGGKTCIIGDGQVSQGNMVVKPNAVKVRRIGDGNVIVGFAGATADAMTLVERLEGKLEAHSGQLLRAAVEMAKVRGFACSALFPLTRKHNEYSPCSTGLAHGEVLAKLGGGHDRLRQADLA